jgi:protocatechuate 3,4-dioxygenase beta subunit
MGLVTALVIAALTHPRPRKHKAHATADGGASATLAGRVLDRRGRPVAAAKLRAQPEGGGAEVAGLSDGEGRFALAVTPDEMKLAVEAAGFRAQELRHLSVPSDEPVEIELEHTLGIEGVVRAGSKPGDGAELELSVAGGTRTTRSGPDGAFRFADVEEGVHALRATRGELAAYLSAVEVHEDDDGGAPLYTVELQSAVAIAGRLEDKNGKPIAGGEIELAEPADAPLPRHARSAADGSFRFEAVLAGAYRLSARAEGFFPSEPRGVEARAKAPLVELRLERGAVVEGRVVDEKGNPVAGASLEVSGEGADGAPYALSADAFAGAATDGATRLEPMGELGRLRGPVPYPPSLPRKRGPQPRELASDPRGHFSLAGLPAGKLVVAARHPDFARGASAPVEARPGATAQVEIRLERGVTVHGRVVDDRGDPLTGAEVNAAGRTVAISDRHGEFVLDHVAARLRLEARAAGYLPAAHDLDPADPLPLELRLERAAGRLAGRVLDERGNPLAGARVDILAAVTPPHTLVTDGGGRFRADALGPGPYRVKVAHGDFAERHFDGIEPNDDALFELSPGGGLAGELRDAREGGVPRGARLELLIAGDKRAIALKGGRFEALALPAGRVQLTASAPGYVRWSRELELPPGERPRELTLRDVEVELERGGTVSGRVRDRDGDPAAGVLVRAGELSATADARGEFRIDGVPPGACRVEAAAGGASAHESLEIRAGDESRIELRLLR